MEFVDTHAHLDFPEFDVNRGEVIDRAKKAGVTIINCVLNREGLGKISPFFDDVYLSIGATPYNLEPGYFESQMGLMQENKDSLVAVGEVGLDYHWVKDKEGREKEQENFLSAIELAKSLEKPLLIHSRNSEKPCLEILEAEGVKKAVMHCFSGSLKEAAHALELGYLISIPTNIARSKQKQELAKEVPLESIVLETDAPYLAPEPGEVNEPINVRATAGMIAEIKKLDVSEVARQTTGNARHFFGL